MPKTQQFIVSLPSEMMSMVKAKVQSGEYAAESDVIYAGLLALMQRDHPVETWLHNQVASACDALRADTSRAVTVEQVRARLAAEHAKRQV